MAELALPNLNCTALVDGEATGRCVLLREPLSFWGGFDVQCGKIIERSHADVGAVLTGGILLMSGGKGSSSSASVLAEAIRIGTAPSAIILLHRDLVVALGCIVASELYGMDVPVVLADVTAWDRLCALPPHSMLTVRARAALCEVLFDGPRDRGDDLGNRAESGNGGLPRGQGDHG